MAELFSYSHEAVLIQKLVQKRIKHSSAVALNSTFIYRDDVLSINKSYFHFYVNSIYIISNELEVKDTKDSETSVSYSGI